jgi:hypothetical protein
MAQSPSAIPLSDAERAIEARERELLSWGSARTPIEDASEPDDEDDFFQPYEPPE